MVPSMYDLGNFGKIYKYTAVVVKMLKKKATKTIELAIAHPDLSLVLFLRIHIIHLPHFCPAIQMHHKAFEKGKRYVLAIFFTSLDKHR